MKETLMRVKFTRYDLNIKEPPFYTYKIDDGLILKPLDDDGGVLFANRLMSLCAERGYKFQFYSTCSDDDNFDLEIVVYPESGYYPIYMQ